MRRILLIVSATLGLASPALANTAGFGEVQPWAQCRSAVRAAERAGAIPEHLLAAIARIESGRRDPQTGRSNPWPWTINVEGRGFFFESKAEAINAVRDFQARGARSIDVGCMQINLMHHPNAFASLEQAFDPMTNAAYGARFLNQLHDITGDWPKAAARYHSATPELGADYQQKVLAVLPEEKQNQASIGGGSVLANAWARTLSGPPAAPAQFTASLPASRGSTFRIIPLSTGGGGMSQGRGLDAYRSMPIAIASRLQRGVGG